MVAGLIEYARRCRVHTTSDVHRYCQRVETFLGPDAAERVGANRPSADDRDRCDLALACYLPRRVLYDALLPRGKAWYWLRYLPGEIIGSVYPPARANGCLVLAENSVRAIRSWEGRASDE